MTAKHHDPLTPITHIMAMSERPLIGDLTVIIRPDLAR